MAALYSVLEKDMREALRSGDQVKLSVLRMAISDCKNLGIAKNVDSLDDVDTLKILQKHLKQHKESIAQFEKGARPDLVEKESRELVIIESYLPVQMTEEELSQVVKEAIIQTGSSSKKDTGKVMKAVMAMVGGKADGKAVSAVVSRLLP